MRDTERFSQIIVPLMEGLSERHHISAVPDILSIAPGFWSQLRQSVADQTAQKAAVEQGTLSLEEAKAKFDPWRSMTEREKKWFEGRTFEILRHCARGWRGGRDVRGKKFRPTLLWRKLNFPPFPFASFQRVVACLADNAVPTSQARRIRSRRQTRFRSHGRSRSTKSVAASCRI